MFKHTFFWKTSVFSRTSEEYLSTWGYEKCHNFIINYSGVVLVKVEIVTVSFSEEVKRVDCQFNGQVESGKYDVY